MLNPKLHFKIIYSINKLLDTTKGYFELKDIYYNNGVPKSEQGIEFHKLLTIYNLLMDNILSIELLNEVITIAHVDSNDLDLVINEFNKAKESNDYISLLRYLLINYSFNCYTYELTSFLINKLLIENDDIPIIFTRYSLEVIEQQIKLGANDLLLKEILSELEIRTHFYLNRYDDGLNKNKIFQIVLDNKELFINNGYNAVWLFGSFSVDKATPYSDIDLFVSRIDITKSKSEAKEFFESIFHRLVDIHFIDETFIGDSDINEDVKVLIFDERIKQL